MGEDVVLCGKGTHVVVQEQPRPAEEDATSPDASAMLRFTKKYQPHSTIDAGAESAYKQCLLTSAREMLGRCEADADASEETQDVQRARRRLGLNRPGFSSEWAAAKRERRESNHPHDTPAEESGDNAEDADVLPWHTDIFTV